MEPPRPNYRAELSSGELHLHFHPARKLLPTLLIMGWSLGWFGFAWGYFRQETEAGRGISWFAAFAFAFGAWQGLRMFFIALGGAEDLNISMQTLRYRRSVFGIGRYRDYHLSDVKRMRVIEGAVENDNQKSCLAFDYGAKTVKMAHGMEEAEIKMILDEIRRRRPDLCDSNPQIHPNSDPSDRDRLSGSFTTLKLS